MDPFLIHGLNPNAATEVLVDEMPEDTLRCLLETQEVEVKQCYYNAALAVISGHEWTEEPIRYVLGATKLLIDSEAVIEHAFIKVGENYYDPTLQVHSKIERGYYSLVEFSRDELFEFFAKRDNEAPQFWILQRDAEYNHLFDRSALQRLEELSNENRS